MGDRVTVQWEEGHFSGTVVDVKTRKGLFLVHYDDGDKFWESYDPVLNALMTTDHD